MSYYEISSMLLEIEKSDTTASVQVTDEEWKEAEELLLSVTLNDPSVRI